MARPGVGANQRLQTERDLARDRVVANRRRLDEKKNLGEKGENIKTEGRKKEKKKEGKKERMEERKQEKTNDRNIEV